MKKSDELIKGLFQNGAGTRNASSRSKQLEANLFQEYQSNNVDDLAREYNAYLEAYNKRREEEKNGAFVENSVERYQNILGQSAKLKKKANDIQYALSINPQNYDSNYAANASALAKAVKEGTDAVNADEGEIADYYSSYSSKLQYDRERKYDAMSYDELVKERDALNSQKTTPAWLSKALSALTPSQQRSEKFKADAEAAYDKQYALEQINSRIADVGYRDKVEKLDDETKQLLTDFDAARTLQRYAGLGNTSVPFNTMVSDDIAQTEADERVNATKQALLGTINPNTNKRFTEEEIADYADYLAINKGKQEAAESAEKNAKFATEHPLLAVGKRTADVFVGGIGSTFDTLGQSAELAIGNRSNIDVYNPAFQYNRNAQTIDQTIMDNNDFMVGDVDLLDFGYKVATSIADNVLRTVASGGNSKVAAIYMATQGFGQAVQDSVEKGYSPTKAIANGVINAGIEAITEKYSLEIILDQKAAKSILVALGKSFLAEGSEEVAGDALSAVADAIMNGNYSEIATQYNELVANGVAPKQALAEVAKNQFGDLVESFLVGGFSGGIMGGGAYLSQFAGNAKSKAVNAVGGKVSDIRNTNALMAGNADVQAAADLNVDSETNDRYKKALEAYKAVSENATKKETKSAQKELKSAARKVASQLRLSTNEKVTSALKTSLNEELSSANATEEQIKSVEKLVDRKVLTEADNKNIEDLRDSVGADKLQSIFQTANNAARSESAKIQVDAALKAGAKTLPNTDDYNKTQNGDTVIHNDNSVEVIGIDAKSGNITLSDKSVVKPSEIEMSEDMADVIEGVKNIGRRFSIESGDLNTIFAYAKSAIGNNTNSVALGLALDDAMMFGYIGQKDLNRSSYIASFGNNPVAMRAINEAYKMAAESSRLAKNTESVKVSKSTKKGTVRYEDVNISEYSEDKQTEARAVESISSLSPIETVIYDSSKRTDDFATKNGAFYKDGRLWVDINAEQGVLGAFAHELTHFMREFNEGSFNKIARILISEYGSGKYSAMDAADIARNYANSLKMTVDDAFEEYVADCMTRMLTDSNAAETIAKLRAADAKLADKIASFIRDAVAKIKAALSGTKAKGYSEITKSLDRWQELADLFAEGVAGAMSAYELGNTGMIYDGATGTVVMDSAKYAPQNAKEVNDAADALVKQIGCTKQEAVNWINNELSLASIILNDKFLDYEADDRYEAIKKDSDYPQGTLDFSNICRKRREYTAMMDRIQSKFPNHIFTADDMAKVREIMMSEGMEVACGLCYVEDRRQRLSEIAGMFRTALKNTRAGNTDRLKDAQVKILKNVADTYNPSVYDLASNEGFAQLEKTHPQIAAAFKAYNNLRGMQSGRLFEGEAEYKRQILEYSQEKVKKINDLGGLRVYSFSDFEEFHLIDIVQAIIDCARIGIKIQGYTKVPSFAKLLANTNAKINRSLIPAGATGYHIENGKAVLDYDAVEGIDINDKDFFDSIDSENIGNILIGINAQQIKAAMVDEFVDYIIPFHTGQKKSVLKIKKLDGWVNYKKWQTDKDASTKQYYKNGTVHYKKSDVQINIYTDVLARAEAEGEPIKNKVEFVNKFLSVCKEKGIVPRFYQFLDTDKNGDFVYTEGYHKFLVDFKLFDKNGNILPHKEVVPDFDNEFMTKLLKDYVSDKENKAAELSEKQKKVENRIVAEIINAPKASKYDIPKNIKNSVKDSEGKMLTEQQAEYFKNSKVRDADGNLLVVYHGTDAEFNVFDISRGRPDMDIQGAFFSPDRADAEGYGVAVKPYYINLTNLADFDTAFSVFKKLRGEDNAGVKTREELIRLGYDGVNNGDEFIAFYPEQIKLTSNEKPTSDVDVRYSERDSEYLELAQNPEKNEARLGEMVDEAAKAAGYTVKVWHGTQSKFTKFKLPYEELGIHLGTKQQARVFAGRGKNAVMQNNFIKLNNPIRLDEDLGSWYGKNVTIALFEKGILSKEEAESIVFTKDKMYRRSDSAAVVDLRKLLTSKGYDGIIYPNYFEGKTVQDSYIVWDKSAVKSADLVTYDDNGNIIPLSERFNSENEDIRYSERGNGYDGYSMSNNARNAYADGEMPLSKWRKSDILYVVEEMNPSIDCSTLTLDTLRDKFLKRSSWHHTSMYYNRTDFYSINEEYVKGLSQADVDNLAASQTSKPVVKRDVSLDEKIDEAFVKMKAIIESGIVKTEKGALKRLIDGKDFDADYAKAVEIIRARDAKKVNGWRNLPAEHYRQKQVKLYDNDIGAYIKALYANEKLSRNSNMFNEIRKHFAEQASAEIVYSRKGSPIDITAETEYSEILKKLKDTQLVTGKSFKEYAKAKEKSLRHAEYARDKLVKENEQLAEMVRLQRKQTKGKVITPSSINTVAKRIYKETGARGNVDEFAKLLGNLYNGIINGEEITLDMNNSVVDWLVEHHKAADKNADYQAVRKFLRGSKVYLSPSLRTEIEALYGSVAEYSKLINNAIKFTNDETDARFEDVWADLANEFSEFFDGNATEINQPAALADVLDALEGSTTELQEYQDSLEDVKMLYLELIYEGYTDVSTLYTVADQYGDKILKLKLAQKKKIAELKKESAARLAEVEKAYKEEKREFSKAKTAEREALRKELVAKYTEMRRRNVEGRSKTVEKNKILRAVKELDTLLNKGNKKRNVKIGMEDLVEKALYMTDVLFNDVKPNHILRGIISGKIQANLTKKERMLLDEYELIDGTPAPRDDAKAREEKKNKLLAIEAQLANLIEREAEGIKKRGVFDAINGLKDAYNGLKKSNESYISDVYNAAIAERIGNFAEEIQNKHIEDLTAAQMHQFYEVIRMVSSTISNANKEFVMGQARDTTELGESTGNELAGGKDTRYKIFDPFKRFFYADMKPVFYFEHIGSKTLKTLFDNVREGEKVFARDVEEARDFILKTKEKYGFDEWDLDKVHTFKLTSGQDFKINLNQMMSIYAYSRREQALEHMAFGGFSFADKAMKDTDRKFKPKIRNTSSRAFRVNSVDFRKIADEMKEEQKKYVIEMQNYLTQMGGKGNEVSRELYGIDIFKEKVYFPLMSDEDFRKSADTKAANKQLENSGFTKETVPNADNPIILDNFTDVWGEHINKMSLYHSMTLPIRALRRTFEYTGLYTTGDNDSVRKVMTSRFDKFATNYLNKFIQDLNGGITSEESSFLSSLFTKMKKSAVAASTSVVIQQPTAIARAMALINPKYFVAPKAATVNVKKNWEEAKRYAPVVIIKEIGGFDTGAGKGVSDWLNSAEYSGFKNKLKGFAKDSQYRDDVLSAGAEFADEVGWSIIWEAVKKETADKTNLSGEELLKAAGKRFDEVITYTQVYDSVTSRSSFMRSKAEINKMATAFMGEPTTSINLLSYAIIESKRGKITKAHAGRIVSATLSSIVFAAMAKCLPYALRDDDDDETFAEKYVDKLTDALFGLGSEIAPWNMVPYLKDLISIWQGYDVDRADITIISDLVNAIKGLDSTKKSGWVKMENLLGSIGALFGVPVKNLMRTMREIYNLFLAFING